MDRLGSKGAVDISLSDVARGFENENSMIKLSMATVLFLGVKQERVERSERCTLDVRAIWSGDFG